MAYLHKMFDFHKTQVYKIMNILNINEYQAMWIAFIKGILVTLLLTWAF